MDGSAEALIEIGDVLRPGSYRAVERLRRLGVRSVLATGDREVPARAVASALGVDEVRARCTPEVKADLVRDLQEQGHPLARPLPLHLARLAGEYVLPVAGTKEEGSTSSAL